MERPDFRAWWERVGKYHDPDTDDVSWFDKRRALAELAFDAAVAQSGNYVCDTTELPSRVEFANGRIVRMDFARECLVVASSRPAAGGGRGG